MLTFGSGGGGGGGAQVLWSASSSVSVSTAPTFQYLTGTYLRDQTGPGSSLCLRAWGELVVDAGAGTPRLSVRMGNTYLQVSLGEQTSSGLWMAELHAARSPLVTSNELRGMLVATASSDAGESQDHAYGTDDWVDAQTNFLNLSARWDNPSSDRVLRLHQVELIHTPRP